MAGQHLKFGTAERKPREKEPCEAGSRPEGRGEPPRGPAGAASGAGERAEEEGAAQRKGSAPTAAPRPPAAPGGVEGSGMTEHS